jgi:hypothetical protein
MSFGAYWLLYRPRKVGLGKLRRPQADALEIEAAKPSVTDIGLTRRQIHDPASRVAPGHGYGPLFGHNSLVRRNGGNRYGRVHPSHARRCYRRPESLGVIRPTIEADGMFSRR